MRAKPEYRNRERTEVAVLDALADHPEEGMTVFELRTRVDEDIDTLEDALASLKGDGLIDASENGQRTVIVPDERAVGPVEPEDDDGILDAIRRRLPF